MTEEQLNALVSWVRLAIEAGATGEIYEAIREGEAERVLRNSFGFHQHSDHSGPFYAAAYEGERPVDPTTQGSTV